MDIPTLTDIRRMLFTSLRSSQNLNESPTSPASVDTESAHLRDPIYPAVADFLSNVGIYDSNQPTSSAVATKEEMQWIEHFSHVPGDENSNRAGGNKITVGDTPTIPPRAIPENNPSTDSPHAATNRNSVVFPNVWLIG